MDAAWARLGHGMISRKWTNFWFYAVFVPWHTVSMPWYQWYCAIE